MMDGRKEGRQTSLSMLSLSTPLASSARENVYIPQAELIAAGKGSLHLFHLKKRKKYMRHPVNPKQTPIQSITPFHLQSTPPDSPPSPKHDIPAPCPRPTCETRTSRPRARHPCPRPTAARSPAARTDGSRWRTKRRGWRIPARRGRRCGRKGGGGMWTGRTAICYHRSRQRGMIRLIERQGRELTRKPRRKYPARIHRRGKRRSGQTEGSL